MNKQTARGIDATAIDDDRIAEHLVAHPDFFERNASVLARLRLPHQRGSAAVSLVERQVLVLREKNKVTEEVAETDSLSVAIRLRATFERESRGARVWIEYDGEIIVAPQQDCR